MERESITGSEKIITGSEKTDSQLKMNSNRCSTDSEEELETLINSKKSTSPQKKNSVRMKKMTRTRTSEKGRKNQYRAEGKNWLLTFPQCSLSKKKALENITSKEDLNVKAVVVGLEAHADGTPHLHIIVCLEEKLRTRDPRFWDFVVSKHGDYKVINSPKRAYAYVTKEDTDPMIFGTIPNIFLESKTSKSDSVANSIITGSTVAQVVATHPGFSLMNLAKIISYKSYVTSVCSTKSCKSLVSPIVYHGEDVATISIIEWLNGNLFAERPFKQKQMWLYGPPNCLKTSLLMKLMEFFRLYPVPQTEDYFDSYSDEDYDILVFDDFKAEKTIHFLNRFLQGGLPVCLKIKNGQVWKRKNTAAIFCSNFSISEVYHKAHIMSVNALKERVTEINVEIPIDMDNIDWEIKDDDQ